MRCYVLFFFFHINRRIPSNDCHHPNCSISNLSVAPSTFSPFSKHDVKRWDEPSAKEEGQLGSIQMEVEGCVRLVKCW